MRRFFIAGNWKMNLNAQEASTLTSGIVEGCRGNDDVDVAVCPPFVYLSRVAGLVQATNVHLGAQNVYFEPNGAFTGEISTSMLKDVGCQYVILGHSERRLILGETDFDVNRKLRAAFGAGLRPIVCVGETLEQREAGKTLSVIESQFRGSLDELSPEHARAVIIAYEPVWAIGTGKVATPAQAEEVHVALRKLFQTVYTAELAEEVRILYGGSVKADNAEELLRCQNIDGVLVGGASLTVAGFLGIIKAARSLAQPVA